MGLGSCFLGGTVQDWAPRCGGPNAMGQKIGEGCGCALRSACCLVPSLYARGEWGGLVWVLCMGQRP